MVAPSESPLLRWVFSLLDRYFAGPNLIWVVFLEAVMIAYTYGVATFVEDLVEMTRLPVLRRAAPVFYVFYYVLTPGALGVVSPHTLYARPRQNDHGTTAILLDDGFLVSDKFHGRNMFDFLC